MPLSRKISATDIVYVCSIFHRVSFITASIEICSQPTIPIQESQEVSKVSFGQSILSSIFEVLGIVLKNNNKYKYIKIYIHISCKVSFTYDNVENLKYGIDRLNAP